MIFCVCEIYQKEDILDAYLWIKYSVNEEKQGDFMRKHAATSQTPMRHCYFF